MHELILAAVDPGARGVLLAVLVAALAAVIAWLVFHALAPRYEALAAIVSFVLVLLILIL